ncbi:MAG: VWA domain-containing protein [Aureispira sp.]|nr:VWA domain-containing protein [Aureispira sp.]
MSILSFCLSAICLSATELNQPLKELDPNRTPKIQVALLLDTSGSMDGLIEQAKSQLWKMINELATSKKDGKSPIIELALYEYGKSSLPQEKGYLQELVPLTSDLDLVSEKLFALSTNGGDEYCGWVIQDATENLKWSESNEDLKIIIIAGNEIFTQGTIDYKKACKGAITNGIVVNTIYCGDCKEGINFMWKDGADRADGKYMCINQNDKVAHIETPYDSEIGKLNEALNKTYIAFGQKGKEKQARQLSQDSNAKSYGASNNAERAISKSKKSTYNNATWDAVDAMAENDDFIEEVEEESLPEEMKDMDMEERKEYVGEKGKERAVIQAKIQEAAKKRTAFITKKRKEAAGSEKNTLDAVMLRTVREQAEKQKFKFEKE